MGLVLAKLYRLFWTNKEYKVVIIGLDNAGKTTLLYRLLTNEQITTSPTIGSNVEEVVWKNIHFICWDLAGQTSFQKSWSTYYMNTNFVMVVVDSADRDRLPIIKEQLYNILIHDDLKKASLLIYANKQDLKESMSASEISEKLNLTSIKSHRWQIQACSAKTGRGINEGIEWMASHIDVS